MHFLGLDIGGTKMAAVVMDRHGTEIKRYRSATDKTSYRLFVAGVERFITHIRQESSVELAIGIALPGSLSPVTGMIKNANIQVINGHPLKHDLEQAIKQPLQMANDGNCFALSEACDGAGEHAQTVFGITLGTGCGGGIAINKQPFVGAWGNAAECGHITLPGYEAEQDGPAVRCYCGKYNCVESFISGTGLSERYRQLTEQTLTSEEILTRAAAGQPCATQQIARYRHQLARTLATIVNVLDPHVIVLGGGLSNADSLIHDIGAEIAPLVFTDYYSTPVIKAQHGDSSGMRGAAWLAVRSGDQNETFAN